MYTKIIRKSMNHRVIVIFLCIIGGWSCQDFSRFDCFNSETGCQPSGGLSLDMNIMHVDMQIDSEIEADISPPRDMTLPIDMTLPVDMAHAIDMALPADMALPIDMTIPVDMSPPCQNVEICDGIDNDCDSVIDEDLPPISARVHFSELSSFNSSCSSSDLESEHCQTASNLYCNDLFCNYYGWGPVQELQSSINPEDMSINNIDLRILCLSRNEVTEVSLTYVNLEDYVGPCDGSNDVHKIQCRYAFHMHCTNTLNQSGFGPIFFNNDQATFGCISASEFDTTYAELEQFVASCDGDSDKAKMVCRDAIHMYCQDAGFVGGWGPLSPIDDNSQIKVACVE